MYPRYSFDCNNMNNINSIAKSIAKNNINFNKINTTVNNNLNTKSL